MLPRNDLSIAAVGRIASTAAVEGATDARQEAFQRSLATMLGKSMPADILSKFTDGSFLVKVAGATARMQLPVATQVGSQVALTLVALEPRPTFEVHSQPGMRAYAEARPELASETARPALPEPALAGARAARVAPPEARLAAPADGASAPNVGSSAHAAALLAKAPLTPAGQLPALGAGTEPATLSAAGKILGSVLGASQLSGGAAPTALLGRAPLLTGPPLAPEMLAAALKDVLGKSGLFYESHLAEWASGTRSRAELGQEPQMQRPPAAPAPDGTRLPAALADPATAQLIDLQLQTHEQHRVAWQGQAWPGQDLSWDIARDDPEPDSGASGDAEPEPAWHSSVRLRFAALGQIDARVTLSGQRLQIHIDAGDGAVGALLRQHAGALGLSLDAAGTPLAGLTIRAADADA
ncbi:MAG: flagellar hook-length control protein FliK [Pseudomonadota bacterium]